MVDFLRCSLGIALGSSLLPLPSWASELSSTTQPVSVRAEDLLPQGSLDSTVKVKFPKYLITQERRGTTREFSLTDSTTELQPTIPIGSIDVIEVIADHQEYARQQDVITATGNVVLRFAQAVMTSDRLEVNLKERIAVAKGNVVLQRGNQILRGEKFEYYLVADRGIIYNARGEIDRTSLTEDINTQQELNPSRTILDRALSDRLLEAQPLTEVTASPGFSTNIGSSRDIDLIGGNNNAGGTINRLRFEAERIDFEGTQWSAANLSLTNDPFSPPELELRAEQAAFTQLNEQQSKLTTSKSRLVLDDRLTVPLLLSAFAFDDRPRRAGIFNVAFDGDEKGGLFIERSWTIFDRPQFTWQITPQYFIQRAFAPTTFEFGESDQGGVFNSAVFGIKNKINSSLTPRVSFNTQSSLTSLDLNDVEDNLRAKASLQYNLGNLQSPYRFALEYNYRDRLFNGSLGFQTVQSSIGGVITSPPITLGNTGISLNYQASIQNINADTNRTDLLATERDNDRINLTRYQGAFFLNRNWRIWSGDALPSTQNQGLRYTPIPVVPYLEILTGVQGVTSFYSNGDQQPSMSGTIGLQGQLGHFSRSWLDYTGFKLSYSQNIRGSESPFLFDRLVDRQTLDLGITQQLYGPIRLGFNTTWDLSDNDEISTDYILEYSRRTYNVTLRYNPVLELGSFSLKISDFNWQGNPQPFRDEVTPVIQGIEDI